MKGILICLFLIPVWLFGQNTIGLPDIINYSKHNFRGGLQTWDIKQDKTGVIYAANNEGLLTFDGNYWEIFPLPNKTIVRSVEIADKKVFAGGQDEFGYYLPSKNGTLEFTSLAALLPAKERSFGDVWDIATINEAVFFRTSGRIFKLLNGEITSYVAPTEWSYMGVCNGSLYAHDFNKGIAKFENNAFKPLENNPLPSNDPVTAMLPVAPDNILITTLKNGLYSLFGKTITKKNSPNDNLFKSERIYGAIATGDKTFALATNSKGLYIVDENINIIQGFSRSEGLQNNNVLCVFFDRQGNLWLGLDNGIDFIAYSSPIKQINPAGQDGSGYAAAIFNNQLYLGTSSGLYSTGLQNTGDLSFSKGNFTQVENTKGQVWKLAVINNQVLIGHHEGALVINGNKAMPFSTLPGFWSFLPTMPILPAQQIVAGHYRGLMLFTYANGRFQEAGLVPGFEESSRYIVVDNDGSYWVSHPYHGIFHIVKNNYQSYSTHMYTDKTGLPSVLNNQIYKVKNELVAATEKGIYKFNAQKDKFEPHPGFTSIFGTRSVRYLQDDPSGNIWFIHEKSLGVIDYSGKEPSVVYLPELDRKMLSGFEFIYPVNAQNTFVAGEKGFFHINYDKYKKSFAIPEALIHRVKLTSETDTILFGGYLALPGEKQIQEKEAILKIKHGWKSIQITYSATIYGNQPNVEYSYRLKNFDASWSEWTHRTEKEYTNLPAGTYTFEVKVRGSLGNESSPASYTFTVLPPWYLSTFAKIAYFLLAMGLLYIFYRRQQRKMLHQQSIHEEEQKKMRYIHELELDKSSSELVALKNEKLEAEINFKNSELATSAMHLVKKGELMNKIKSGLNHLIKTIENPSASAEIKKLLKTLGEEEKSDEDWQAFTQHFDKVHSDFTKRLKDAVPGITASELKLCAYLRMNLSTKEIAQLLNISVRGVEIGRYRLRKKLNLSTEVSLFDYLMGI